jgi:multisubunit Na+/H+ antiporter MnhG subunit
MKTLIITLVLRVSFTAFTAPVFSCACIRAIYKDNRTAPKIINNSGFG